MEKRLIAILSVCLGIALLTIAFLLGRMTAVPKVGTPTVAADRAPVTSSVPALSVAPPLTETTDGNQTFTPAVPKSVTADIIPVPGRQTPADAPQAIRNTGDAEAIAEYFAKVDAIHAMGSGDPNAYAQQILGGLEGGDLSGFDNLLNSAKAAAAQTAALQPPPACAAYHRQLVETLSESTAIMEKLRAATQSGDLTGITELSAQIGTLQQKTNELEVERKQLTRQ